MSEVKGRVILVSANGPRLASQIRRQCGLELVKVTNPAECLQRIISAEGDFDAVLLDADPASGPFDLTPFRSIEARYPHIGTFVTSTKKINHQQLPRSTNGLHIPYLPQLQLKNQLGTFVHARRLRSRLGEKIAHLNSLVEFANALASITTEADIAKETHRCLSQVVPSIDIFHLAVNDEVQERLRSVLLIDAHKISRKRLGTEHSQSALELQVARNRRLLYIRDLKARSNLLSAPLYSSKRAHTYLCLPLISGSSMVGTISLQSYRQNAFDPAQRKIIQSMANQAAVALDRTLQREWKTTQRSFVLAKLYETIDAISTALDGEVIFNLIVANLHTLFNLAFCSIGVFNPGKTRLDIVSERGVGKKISRELKTLPKTLVRKVLTSSSLIEIQNVHRWPLLRKTLVRKDVQSLVLLPLRGKSGTLGVINMGFNGPIHLPVEQRKLLKQLSYQAAVSIEHVLLHKETQTLARKLEEMGQMTLKMSKEPNLDALLETLTEMGASLLDSEGCAIYLLSEKKGTVVLEAIHGMPLKLKKREVRKGLVRVVLEAKKMVVIEDYRHWKLRRRELDELNLTCVMGVPLVGGGKTLGVLVVHSDQDGRIYGGTEQKVLFHFARHAGAAIENIGRAAQDEAIEEITRALTSEVDYSKLLKKVIHAVRVRLHYESFTLMNCDGKELTVAVESVLPAKRTRTIKVGQGITGWVAKYGKIRIEPDVTKAKGYIPGLGSGSEIALPVMLGKEVIAVLDIESEKPNAFRERDVRILKRITAALATAMMASRARSLQNRVEAFVGAQGLDQILKTLAKEMLDVCPATFCHIMLRDPDKPELLRVQAAHVVRRTKEFKWSPQEGKVCHILRDPDLAHTLETEDSTVFVRDDSHGSRVVAAFANHLSLREKLDSILFVPLRGAEGEMIGLITLGEIRSAERAPFTRPKIRAATAFASQASVAVEREQLASEGPAAIGPFKLKNKSPMEWEDREESVRRVAKVARTSLGAEVAAVFLQKKPGYLHLEATSGSKPRASLKGLELKITRREGLTGHIASTGRLFNIHGKALTEHPAVKRRGHQAHIPSGYCHSLLAIPLKRREGGHSEVIGLLKVENKLDHTGRANPFTRFDKRDVVTIKTLGRYLETSLQNAELFNLSTSLHQLGQEVNSTLDFDKVIARVLSGLRDRIPFDTCSLQLLRADQLKVVACEGFNAADKKKVLNLSFPLTSKFPNSEVIAKRRAVLHPDIRATNFTHFWDEHDVYCAGKIRSWLGVPLLNENRPIGMVSIDSEKPSAYTKAHKRYAESMALRISSAIANANLYKTTRSASDIVMNVTEEMNLEAILKKLARALVDKEGIVGADSVVIYLYQPELEHIADEVVTEGVPDADFQRLTSTTTKAIVSSLLTSGARVDRIRVNPPSYAAIARRLGAKTTGALRLAVGDRLVGLMLVHFYSDRTFEKIEQDLLRLVADKASLSIQHARMFQTVQQRFEIAKRAAVNLNAMSAWSHDAKKFNLRLDLSLMLLRKSSHLLTPKARKHLENAIEYSKNITKIPTPPGEVERTEALSVSRVFRAVQKQYLPDLVRKKIKVKDNLKQLPCVMGNEWLLSEALNHLTQNAIKALKPGGKITLSGQVKSGIVSLLFSDNGCGIKPAVRKILFDRRVPSNDEGEFGMGLLLSKMYLNAVNGDLNLKQTSRRGTVFVLSLPVAE
jgi:GAF domain-containing protein